MCILSVSSCQYERSSSTSEYRISKLIISEQYFLSSLISIHKLCSHCPGRKLRNRPLLTSCQCDGLAGELWMTFWHFSSCGRGKTPAAGTVCWTERYCRVDTTSIYIISNNAPSGQWCWRQESKRFFFSSSSAGSGSDSSELVPKTGRHEAFHLVCEESQGCKECAEELKGRRSRTPNVSKTFFWLLSWKKR